MFIRLGVHRKEESQVKDELLYKKFERKYGSFHRKLCNFLNAFEELRKATVSVLTSVCLAVRIEQLGASK